MELIIGNLLKYINQSSAVFSSWLSPFRTRHTSLVALVETTSEARSAACNCASSSSSRRWNVGVVLFWIPCPVTIKEPHGFLGQIFGGWEAIKDDMNVSRQCPV